MGSVGCFGQKENIKRQSLIQLGTPCEIVAKATGLSMEEVAKLKEKEEVEEVE